MNAWKRINDWLLMAKSSGWDLATYFLPNAGDEDEITSTVDLWTTQIELLGSTSKWVPAHLALQPMGFPSADSTSLRLKTVLSHSQMWVPNCRWKILSEVVWLRDLTQGFERSMESQQWKEDFQMGGDWGPNLLPLPPRSSLSPQYCSKVNCTSHPHDNSVS